MNKFIFFFFIFGVSLQVYATCSDSEFTLVGHVSFKYRNTDKTISTKSEEKKFPKKWNINSDYFDVLSIKSKKNIESVILIVKNDKKKFLEKKISVNKKKSVYFLESFSFKNFIKSLNEFPYEMELKLQLKDKKKCSLVYTLEGGD